MGRLINASDAKAWKHCPRQVWFDYHLPEEEGEEAEEDAFDLMMQELGLQHEEDVKNSFREVVTAESEAHTIELMAQGAPVIYQPVLVDEKLGVFGQPDFLIKNDNGEYQIADAKLAASTRGHPEIKLQLGTYRLLLGSKLPALAYLRPGDIEEIGSESEKESLRFIREMQALLKQKEQPATHFSHSKCTPCPYHSHCRPQFEAAEELTLLAGLDARSAKGLRAQGITDITALAAADPEAMPDVPYLKGFEKKKRAVLQAQSYLSGEIHQVAPLELPAGPWVHFDVEANPLSDIEGGQVYLWGLLPPPYKRENFEYVWSEASVEGDRAGWLAFLDKILEYHETYPGFRLVHFSPFEVVQIKLYAERYQMFSDPRVEFLLGKESPLFDLLPVIKRSLVLPLASYGLKQICKNKRLVDFSWELEESGSQWSVVRFIDFLEEESAAKRKKIQQEILTYNRDDVLATRALEVWLQQFE